MYLRTESGEFVAETNAADIMLSRSEGDALQVDFYACACKAEGVTTSSGRSARGHSPLRFESSTPAARFPNSPERTMPSQEREGSPDPFRHQHSGYRWNSGHTPKTADEGILQLEAYAAETTMLGRSMPLDSDISIHPWPGLDPQQQLEDPGEWVDQQVLEGNHPWSSDEGDVYAHYAHGVRSHGTSPMRFNVGAYGGQGGQQQTMTRKDIADALHAGRWDNVQLYRVLKADLQAPQGSSQFVSSHSSHQGRSGVSSSPSSGHLPSHLPQGSWRRPRSSPARHGRY